MSSYLVTLAVVVIYRYAHTSLAAITRMANSCDVYRVEYTLIPPGLFKY